jgi:hypothetical protein
VEHHRRLFVVAEWDDSHIYHTLLGESPTQMKIISSLLPQRSSREWSITEPSYSPTLTSRSWSPSASLHSPQDLPSLLSVRVQRDEVTRDAAQLQRVGLCAADPRFTPFLPPPSSATGISADRLVFQKDVFANEVYLPRYGGCQDPVYNTWELLAMREFFLSLPPPLSPPPQTALNSTPRKPVILLMSRSPSSGFGRNKGDPVRQWSPEFVSRFEEQLRSNFPSYEVRVFSDTDATVMGCLSCHAQIFSAADVLVGVHGAGFANQIYMRPGRCGCPHPHLS